MTKGEVTVTVRNMLEEDRVVLIKIWGAENLTLGLKKQGESNYMTCFYSMIGNTPESPKTVADVVVPKNETITFEFVTLLGGGLSGIRHSIVIE